MHPVGLYKRSLQQAQTSPPAYSSHPALHPTEWRLRCRCAAWEARHCSVGGASGASPRRERGMGGASLQHQRGVIAAATRRWRRVSTVWERRGSGLIAAARGGMGGASPRRGRGVGGASLRCETEGRERSVIAAWEGRHHGAGAASLLRRRRVSTAREGRGRGVRGVIAEWVA